MQTDTQHGRSEMSVEINGRTYNAKQVGDRFFYFSTRALRWLPVARAKVSFK